jgi:hypothetical protein
LLHATSAVDGSRSLKKKANIGWILVAHAYNPSSSGGSDQENPCSKPAQANTGETLYRNTKYKKG